MKRIIPILTAVTLLFYACSDEEIQADVQTEQQQDLAITKLGDDLNVPYTTANMTKAFDQVLAHLDVKKPYGKSQFALKSGFAAKSTTAKSIKIVPSHYYYRFLPKDSIQYETLVNDTILAVSNVPLHKQVVEAGDAYDDPNIEGDETGEAFGWFYSVVPYDYDFPNHIEHEQLENMYFAPELDEDEPLESGESKVYLPQNKTTKDLLTVDENGEVFEYLELEALKLTNNLDEKELEILRFYLPNDASGITYTFEEASRKGYEMPELILDYDSVVKLLNIEDFGTSKSEASLTARRRRWSPDGTITVTEDALRNKKVGVMGAEVRVRKWGFLVIRRARTDRNGDFKTRSTRTKRVKYAVYFNNWWNFTVKAGSIFWNARHRGTRRYKRRGWEQNFTGGRAHFYALVQNAAYDYYNRVIYTYGLIRPRRHLKISANYNACTSSQFRPHIIPFASTIRVTRMNGRCRYRGSDGIYATTVHELTHSGHRQMDPGMFSVVAGSCRRESIKESWAEAVEAIVTNDRYERLDQNYLVLPRMLWKV